MENEDKTKQSSFTDQMWIKLNLTHLSVRENQKSAVITLLTFSLGEV